VISKLPSKVLTILLVLAHPSLHGTKKVTSSVPPFLLLVKPVVIGLPHGFRVCGIALLLIPLLVSLLV
jgi:hypothetical protein